MKYKLLIARTTEELNEQVDCFLNKGYTLYQAPFYCPESPSTKEAFAQAVVKYPAVPQTFIR